MAILTLHYRYDAAPSSKVAINVWHRSQSKKKKRRVLVANASCCIGELMKKQEGADGSESYSCHARVRGPDVCVLILIVNGLYCRDRRASYVPEL